MKPRDLVGGKIVRNKMERENKKQKVIVRRNNPSIASHRVSYLFTSKDLRT